MRIRPTYLGIAALLLLAVAVIGFRHCDRGDASPPASAQPVVPVEPPAPAPAQRAVREPPAPALPQPADPAPGSVGRDSADDTEGRGPTVSATAPSQSSVDDEISIPTELPDSPSLEKKLSRDGAVRDYREAYNYQLGLMAFYQRCMRGRISRGVIYYYVKWGVDEETHLASSPFFDSTGVPPEGDVTPEDEAAFAACVKEYLATHDHVYLPHGSASGETWGLRAVFPLRDSTLLKMIAEAKAERGSHAPSRPATSPD